VDFGDIYFSTDGGPEETRTVFLGACGLPERWQDSDYFAIGELGFGTGLNFLETMAAWRESPSRKNGAILHFVSIEKFPLDKLQLWEVLKPLPVDLSLKMSLCNNWPGRVKGFHNLSFDDVHLTLIHDDVMNGLRGLEGKFDAWFLDGFSPSKNPDMWTPGVMNEIGRLSRPGAKLGTFTVARAVRDALTSAGFEVVKKQGFGRKRDRLEAIYSGTEMPRSEKEIRPVIIGAGIAGASLAYSFTRRGIKPVIIDADEDTAASGNPAAIVKPRLDLQDRPESRFFLSSYLLALGRYRSLGSILENTVIHQPPTDKERKRYERLLDQQVLPKGHFKTGENAGEFCFPEAVIIDPKMSCGNSMAGAARITGKAHRNENGKVFDEAGNLLAEGTHVIWACGFGIRELGQFSDLGLRYSRGQLSWSKAVLQYAYSYGGYAIPLGSDTLLGATHKRLDDVSPFAARPEDDRENMDKYEAIFGAAPMPSEKPSRSSVRVTTPSTMPAIFGGGSEWGITGLGSRGFVFAPLLSEAIVANICDEVLPVSNKVWTRFRAREKAQPESAS